MRFAWMMKGAVAVACATVALGASAAVIPLAPTGGAAVPLLTKEQKAVMALPTYDARLDWLRTHYAENRKDRERKWRTAASFRLKWRTTADEGGPWKVLLGTKPDLSDARVYWKESLSAAVYEVKDAEQTDEADGKGGKVYRLKLPEANLELGRTYYWQVIANVRCPSFSHGSTMRAPCACGKGRQASASPVASFVTEDLPPRWIKVEGRVGNIRDLGGWKTQDGRRVKQGLVFRGEGLNDNSVNGDEIGRNRLTVEDVKYLTGGLGFKTDLDLRSDREVSSMAESPLGPGVRFVHISSQSYADIFSKHRMTTMAKEFRVFCDRANYPIYFHCIGGADRTGSLAYVLNGVLGVPKHDLETDWEATFYPKLPELEKGYTGPGYWRREQAFDEGFAKYGDKDTPWNKRIELYLLDCGVTPEEIAAVRDIMLEQE